MLKVENLTISFKRGDAFFSALSSVNFQLKNNKITALIGQSGSGKSTLALALLGLLKKAKISGEIIFEKRNLLALDENELRKIRGKNIGIVFQDPNSALNPLHKIGAQIAETVKIHNPKISKKNLQKRILELLKLVELEALSARLDAYPHQISGGQKQRIMLAIAMANNPKILILDEPTTALDISTQNEILKLLIRLKKEFGLTILFITHNLKIVKEIADEVLILKEGRLIEKGLKDEIFFAPKHSYTKMLLAALEFSNAAKPAKSSSGEEILATKKLSVIHKIKKGFFKYENFYANHDINFSLKLGENLGIIGESGSGKSTLAKALLGLIKYEGEIFLDQKIINKKNENFWRKKIQIVFQDPFSSLDPRMLVKDIIAEGLLIHKNKTTCNISCFAKIFDGKNENSHEKLIDKMLETLDLSTSIKHRYPHELSGGQRQRVAIARALILNPEILMLDEPTSALDFITQNEVIKLLERIQSEREISYIIISHDLSVVNQIADKTAILKDGQIIKSWQNS